MLADARARRPIVLFYTSPALPVPAGGGPGKLAEVTFVNGTARWEVTSEYEGGVGGAKDSSFAPHGFVSGVGGGGPGGRGAWCVCW